MKCMKQLMKKFVAISPKEKFPITVDNVKDKYGIISYKTNKLLEN